MRGTPGLRTRWSLLVAGTLFVLPLWAALHHHGHDHGEARDHEDGSGCSLCLYAKGPQAAAPSGLVVPGTPAPDSAAPPVPRGDPKPLPAAGHWLARAPPLHVSR
jgi:hypothetical protein